MVVQKVTAGIVQKVTVNNQVGVTTASKQLAESIQRMIKSLKKVPLTPNNQQTAKSITELELGKI